MNSQNLKETALAAVQRMPRAQANVYEMDGQWRLLTWWKRRPLIGDICAHQTPVRCDHNFMVKVAEIEAGEGFSGWVVNPRNGACEAPK